MMVSEFKNEPYTDFSTKENQKKMQAALREVGGQLGREYDLIIGSQRLKADQTFTSINPSDKDEIIGVFQKAAPEQAEAAIQSALETFETWRWVDPAERAEYLFKAAEVMRRRRFELDAWMVLEEGKNWLEADADVAEAIDFCDFYGREMLRLAAEQPLTQIPTEKSELVYIPLGVGVVIPPWNFPLAILVGMTSAALVTGNTVVLKPSSDSPAMGYRFMEVLEEVGLPPGVVNFVTGSGAAIGDTLVGHPKTRFISFTGSKEVGLGIVELAAKTAPGQIWIKRVVAEMGGKDAIVVDHETDLDRAAQGVVTAAFGFQGQKCSACSRAIVVDSIYDELLELIKEKTEKLTVGPVIDQKNYMGPVINQRAMESILQYIEIGKKEGRLVTGGGPAQGNGFYIQPTVIADVAPGSRIAQEEIFGPVLAVIKARDFEHALQIANDTEYGLTGAVYTDDREKIEKARRIFHCGNLYFNRKCTGALVGVHPFGGFNMSGTDSKAGGHDYLLLFSQAKSISEFTG
jgi:1-pyrroline-5-carboxylate dehydrogenase